MIGWLRRLFSPRKKLTLGLGFGTRSDLTSDQRVARATARRLTDGTAALLADEDAAKRSLALASKARIREPSKADERRAAMEIPAPKGWHGPDFQLTIETIAAEAQRKVEEAEALEAACRARAEELERQVRKEQEAYQKWSDLAHKLDKVVLSSHQVLTDAKVPPKTTLAERVAWLVASRDRARARSRR